MVDSALMLLRACLQRSMERRPSADDLEKQIAALLAASNS
jgi:hypothetical protein